MFSCHDEQLESAVSRSRCTRSKSLASRIAKPGHFIGCDIATEQQRSFRARDADAHFGSTDTESTFLSRHAFNASNAEILRVRSRLSREQLVDVHAERLDFAAHKYRVVTYHVPKTL